MNDDFWSLIETANTARAKVKTYDPNAYPVAGSHDLCDHAADYCALTFDNYFTGGN